MQKVYQWQGESVAALFHIFGRIYDDVPILHLRKYGIHPHPLIFKRWVPLRKSLTRRFNRREDPPALTTNIGIRDGKLFRCNKRQMNFSLPNCNNDDDFVSTPKSGHSSICYKENLQYRRNGANLNFRTSWCFIHLVFIAVFVFVHQAIPQGAWYISGAYPCQLNPTTPVWSYHHKSYIQACPPIQRYWRIFC